MSEYQYYEFQAIDRPLSDADRAALRDLSTRARITATSFTNSYEWGDFKGDPAKRIYYVPGQRGYARLPATGVCFASETEARAAGFQKAPK